LLLAILGLPVHRWGAAIFSPFHPFTFSPLKAIFSPFHPFTFSPLMGVSHLFTFSLLHLFTFKSPLFHIILPIKHKKVGLKFGGIPEKEYLCTR